MDLLWIATDDDDKEEKRMSNRITLDAKELYFLTGIIGSARLSGIEDPFRGYLTDEIAEEWDRAKSALLKKGYLIVQPNGVEVSMPPHVFSCVAVTGDKDIGSDVLFLQIFLLNNGIMKQTYGERVLGEKKG